MKRVLVGGVFNIIHPGHIDFLKESKKHGDYLIVVISHDKNVIKNKGYLVFKAKERKKIIESLRFVNKVIIGDEKDYFKVIRKEVPDVIILGYNQKIDKNYLKKRIKEMGIDCKVIRIRTKFGNYSTKEIINKIK